MEALYDPAVKDIFLHFFSPEPFLLIYVCKVMSFMLIPDLILLRACHGWTGNANHFALCQTHGAIFEPVLQLSVLMS